ncbi:hypothetical protein E0L35_16340 [Halomonas sp. ATBC28]|uniref:hypothetical protein n=1 Tax=Halomonas sp. ATBC28 TaxID=2545264 RepID=UPI00110F3323|nr:hypothetical protein [Halomonas sp. ATBC28]TMU20391.1 hypothetical protein E0L35_16340 [Halomonas sp. ATBC28]
MKRPKEPFLFLRIMMAVSSLSPLFILIAAKGSELIKDIILFPACLTLTTLPTFFLVLRFYISSKNEDRVVLEVNHVENSRDHLLIYLFAVLVPLFQADLNSVRSIFLLISVFSFVLFLFVHLRLYYANVFFAALGYKVYTLTLSNGRRVALLSKREKIETSRVTATRITDFLYTSVGE